MKKYILTVIAFFSFFLLGKAKNSSSPAPIRILDLCYLNDIDLTKQENITHLWDRMHTTATLQGIVNRENPQMYIRYVLNGRGENVDDYWWNKYRQSGQWLADKETLAYTDLIELIGTFKDQIEGIVLYDSNIPSTSNIASAVAGIDNLIAVRYDPAPESLYSQLQSSGISLPVRCFLVNKDGSSIFTGKGIIPETPIPSTGSVKCDPYIWFIENYLKKGKCNTEYGAYYIDQFWRTDPERTVRNHHQLSNHDFFVSKKAFFFDLSPWTDEPATDDPEQTPGLDFQILQIFLEEAYQQNQGQKFCYIGGFPSWIYKYTKHAGGKHEDVPTEWEFSRIISAYNAFKDADAIGLGALANASFWQHFPLEKKYPQPWVNRENLMEGGYLNPDGSIRFNERNFFIFYVGDYDSSSWITQTTSFLWDEPNRGTVPLMWCISPVLAERVPMVMHNYRVTATPNDYFAAADNGAGYLLPGILQAPRPISGLPDGLKAWERHCIPYYEQWDLSITGFIIDGEAPGLNKKGLDCYASFSPNGIVPQKVPSTLLHRNMPVLRADRDLEDRSPAQAAELIRKRVYDRSIPFHWFRAILKSPSWYKEIVDELKKTDPTIELLDAPTFFELYRIWLEQNPDAAQGKE